MYFITIKGYMRKLALLSITLSALFITSCSRYYYKPNAVNAPLFTDGGQAHFNFAGSLGSGDDNTSDESTSFFDIQAAVSPIKHLGLIGNYSTYHYNTLNPDFSVGRVNARAYLLEGGIGGYYAVGENKVKFVIDMYAGGGSGKLSSDVDMNVSRLFLQPGIGITSPWFDFSFNPRVTRVYYSNLDANGHDVQYLQDRGLVDYYGVSITDGGHTFFEPSFTVRTGYKFAKVQFQGAFATPTTVKPWNHNGARFTIGFYFNIEDMIDLAKNGSSK